MDFFSKSFFKNINSADFWLSVVKTGCLLRIFGTGYWIFEPGNRPGYTVAKSLYNRRYDQFGYLATD